MERRTGDWFYDATCGFVRIIRNKLYNVNVKGLENLEGLEGGVIVSNHAAPKENWSFRDGLDYHIRSSDHYWIASFIEGRRIHFVASKFLYKKFWSRFLMNKLRQIPARGNGFVEKCDMYLSRGDYVGIMPEGDVCNVKLNKKAPMLPGLGMLVCNLPNFKIIPAYLSIEEKKDTLIPNFKSANVIFGEPFDSEEEVPFFNNERKKKSRKEHIEISNRVMEYRVFSLGEI